MQNAGQVQSGYAPVRGARIFYKVIGEGKPLVLVHAGIADSRMWDRQVNDFARRYRVITYDLRGFGKSDSPPGEFAHYKDLAGLLDYLGIQNAALVGCSLGGGTILNLAVRHPDRVAALVLVGSGVEGYQFKDQETKDQWPAIDLAIDQGKYDQAADLEIKLWVAGPRRTVYQVDPDVRDRVHAMLISAYQAGQTQGSEERLEPATLGRLGEVRAPTLVLVGEEDVPDIFRIAELLSNGIAGARRASIPGAAHLPGLERPAEFNQAVMEFLDAVYRSG